MQVLRSFTQALCTKQIIPSIFTQVAGLKVFQLPPKFENVEFPERKRLKVLHRVPQYPSNVRPFKMQKRLRYMRGPEEIHNTLIHKQYGIVALKGGRLKHGHIEMIRLTVGRAIKSSKMFAVWRFDPPWQPISKKSLGVRMGGGKGSIDHYVTPIKAGRIIVEVGGHCEFSEVERVLSDVAAKLPFEAKAVSQELMDEEKAEEERLERENLNPWTWKYIIQNNIGGCHNWISPVDKLWYNKHR